MRGVQKIRLRQHNEITTSKSFQKTSTSCRRAYTLYYRCARVVWPAKWSMRYVCDTTGPQRRDDDVDLQIEQMI